MQLSLPLRYRATYEQKDFIVSSVNKEAYGLLVNLKEGMWGVRPYPCSLILQGDEGSGKTHLSCIYSNLEGALYLSEPNSLPTLEEVMRYKAFVIENIDSLLESKEEQLLHYFNLINEAGKPLLMTRRSSKAYHLPDLDSRIKSLRIVQISPPEQETLALLIAKSFSDKGIIVSPLVVKFISSRMHRNYQQIENITSEIYSFALKAKRKISIPLIKELLDGAAKQKT